MTLNTKIQPPLALSGQLPFVYRSLSHFYSVHGLRPGKETLTPWRLTERVLGHIHGLPLSHGILTATDGMMCYIEQPLGLYKGHIGWFVAEKTFDQSKVSKEVSCATLGKSSRLQKELVIYDVFD